MRYAIISDIHSNVQALDAALACIDKENVDSIICLGDIVGYNANPSECIEMVKSCSKINHIVQGNHDDGAVRLDKMSFREIGEWSEDAIHGLRYSKDVLNENDLNWLKDRPERETIDDPNIKFHICHYSPCGMSASWGYILDKPSAQDAIYWLKASKINLAFFGHSHLPTVVSNFNQFSKDIDFVMGNVVCEKPIEIEKDRFYAINCGSVGQPRNKGYTTYGIFDSEKMLVNIKPFEYNISGAQKAIMEAKYQVEEANIKLAKRLGKFDDRRYS